MSVIILHSSYATLGSADGGSSHVSQSDSSGTSNVRGLVLRRGDGQCWQGGHLVVHLQHFPFELFCVTLVPLLDPLLDPISFDIHAVHKIRGKIILYLHVHVRTL